MGPDSMLNGIHTNTQPQNPLNRQLPTPLRAQVLRALALAFLFQGLRKVSGALKGMAHLKHQISPPRDSIVGGATLSTGRFMGSYKWG